MGSDPICVTVRAMKKPGKDDPSRPRKDGYEYKRDFYRSDSVADDYDFHRFSSPERENTRARARPRAPPAKGENWS